MKRWLCPWLFGCANTSAGLQLHAPIAYAHNYNLNIERDIVRHHFLEVGFVGSKGTHLGRRYNINQPFRSIPWYTANGTNCPALYPALSTINYSDFESNSIYSRQIMLRNNAGRGFFYRLGYSYSKSIDEASQLTGASSGGYGGALDSRNLSLERARSDFDRGHVFTAMVSYPLPLGLKLSGTVLAATGQPFTVLNSSINANIGQSDRPNRIAKGVPVSGDHARGLDYSWYSRDAFVSTPDCTSRTNCAADRYGFLPFAPGNSGRNILDGPSLINTNMALFKKFALKERRSIQARWEMFNVLNHANFQLPNRNFNETSGGIISASGTPRIMQFAVKVIF